MGKKELIEKMKNCTSAVDFLNMKAEILDALGDIKKKGDD